MRYSSLFARTKRDAPADITDATLRLAYRAGLIRPVERGQFIYLPLAANVISQMLLMLRADLNELGAQEIRGDMVGSGTMRDDAHGTSRTNLDILASAEIQSYKQLPARLFWHTGGVTRLQVASLEPNLDAAKETLSIFEKIALEFFEYAGVEPQTALDIDNTRVWYADSPPLDLEILKSTAGTYAATRAAATLFKGAIAANSEAFAELPESLQEIETPHCDTIEALARHLNVPTRRTAKAVFYSTGERIIFAVIRGDLQIDENKVKRALKTNTLRWATDQEIARVGAVPGYASPIGTHAAMIIVDDSIVNSPNLVAGANKPGYHLLNTNVPRDYKPDLVSDIALARAGDASPDGSGELELVPGIALARSSAPRELDANFLDMNGKAQKQMGVMMELDFGAVVLAHIGAHHDDKGISWSRTLAPYDAHVVVLNGDRPEVSAVLESLNVALDLAGVEALVDDRNDSAGVKFNDADLIGLPLRITIGPKTVAQGSVELKPRGEANARPVALDALSDELNKWMER